jgi:hypothetical protein
MTWSDPIVEEVRRVREAYAARFNYDLQAMYRDLKEKEKRSGRKTVSVGENTEDQALKALPAEKPVTVEHVTGGTA